MGLRPTKGDQTRARPKPTWGRPPSAVRPSEARQLEEFRQSEVEGRAAKSFSFVIPSRLEPRLRGENVRGICSSGIFPQPVGLTSTRWLV